MRFLGNVKTKKQAIEQGMKIVKDKKRTFVYEKALCKERPSGRKRVCYRGWLDRDDKSARVLSMQEWKKEK